MMHGAEGAAQGSAVCAKPVLVSRWHHPGTCALALGALCVEVNWRRRDERKWTMPRAIGEVQAALAAVGVHSAAQLAVRLAPPGGEEILGAELAAAAGLASEHQQEQQQGLLDAEALSLFAHELGLRV